MFTLRCTGRLLKRLKVHAAPLPPRSTTRLGDWYANLLYTKPQQLVLCVSAKTLLPVLVPGSGPTPVEMRLRDQLAEVLRAVGVSEAGIQSELLEMEPVVVSKTASRTVLGSMNDFVNMLSFYPPNLPVLERAVMLAESPCSPIGMDSPKQATVELFGRPQLRLVR